MSIKAGDVFKTTRSSICVVLEYIDSRKVMVKFIETGYTTTVSAQQVRNGNVLDRRLMLTNNKAKLDEKKKPKYKLELNNGTFFFGKSYRELSEKSNVSLDALKSYACGRALHSSIKTLNLI